MAKIIFCDDDETIRRLIGVIMQSSPHEAYLAANGRDALAIAERESPDLIFVDAFMPDLTGFQFLEEIKSRPSISYIPVVLVTASSNEDTLQSLKQQDWAGYLAKPFHVSDLRAKINEMLGKIIEPNRESI